MNLLIFAHEIGHYSAMKYFGIKVEKIKIGIGPNIVLVKQETIYSLGVLPIGGFVKASDENLLKAPFWQYFAILISGSLFNVIFAILLVIIISFAPDDKIREFKSEFRIKNSQNPILKIVFPLIMPVIFWLINIFLAIKIFLNIKNIGGPFTIIKLINDSLKDFWSFCSVMILINISFAVINSLPLYPIDGGQIVRAALTAWGSEFAKSLIIPFEKIGIIILILLIMAALRNDLKIKNLKKTQ